MDNHTHQWQSAQVKADFEPMDISEGVTRLYSRQEYMYLYCRSCGEAKRVKVQQPQQP